MNTKEKILQYLDFKGVGKRDFYRQTGLSNGFLDSGEYVGSNNLKIIIDKFPDLSLDWLVLDKGDMIIKGNLNGSENSNEKGNLKGNLKGKLKGNLNVPEEVQLLALLSDFGKPLIPIEAMAGFGTAEAAQVFENHITERYVIPDFKGKVDYFIRVTGSSMYPKYNSGDVVACKMIENLSFVQWNKTYVLDTSQGAIVKRLIKSSKAGCITCRSDNKDYPDFELNINDDIHAIALIIGVIRFE